MRTRLQLRAASAAAPARSGAEWVETAIVAFASSTGRGTSFETIGGMHAEDVSADRVRGGSARVGRGRIRVRGEGRRARCP
jgi:hypothetical protein